MAAASYLIGLCILLPEVLSRVFFNAVEVVDLIFLCKGQSHAGKMQQEVTFPWQRRWEEEGSGTAGRMMLFCCQHRGRSDQTLPPPLLPPSLPPSLPPPLFHPFLHPCLHCSLHPCLHPAGAGTWGLELSSSSWSLTRRSKTGNV